MLQKKRQKNVYGIGNTRGKNYLIFILTAVILVSAFVCLSANASKSYSEEGNANFNQMTPAYSNIFADAISKNENKANAEYGKFSKEKVRNESTVRTGGDYEKFRNTDVYVGGMPFGIKFQTDGAVVVGFCDVDSGGKRLNPASNSGIKIGDVITGINGTPLDSIESLTEAVDKSEGKSITLQIRRGSEKLDIRVTPIMSDSEKRYKTGIWIRDNGAGIGTVTFMTKEGVFAGLGHGICDGESGTLVNMKSGAVSDVTVSGIIRGTVGTPGEIKGYFTSGKTGTLLGNTECGVYGVFVDKAISSSSKIKVGLRDEIHDGEAYVLCTLDDNTIGKYKVELSCINIKENGNKCYSIHVTDSTLIERTGGIVQGMSGSPIIQDGKLVGAVTHVLINDPTCGYGIFIDNMLSQVGELMK